MEGALRKELKIRNLELEAALRDKDRMKLSALELATQLDVLQAALTTPATQKQSAHFPVSVGAATGSAVMRTESLNSWSGSRSLQLPDPESH